MAALSSVFARGVLLVTAVVLACAIALGLSDSLRAAVWPGDTASMHASIGEYWQARQHSWPAELRDVSKLPEAEAARITRERREALEPLLAGALLLEETRFDAALFLQTAVDAGEMVTESGFEIIDLRKPDYRLNGTANVRARVRSWRETVHVLPDGTLGEPYPTDSTSDYLYTFQREGGRWKIVSENLLSNPLADVAPVGGSRQ